jgi:hypothetical protein
MDNMRGFEDNNAHVAVELPRCAERELLESSLVRRLLGSR